MAFDHFVGAGENCLAKRLYRNRLLRTSSALLSKADPFCASEGQSGRTNTPRCAANLSRPPRIDSQRCGAFAIADLNSLLDAAS